MAKPFKFRYVNEIVGSFVLFVVALLVVGVVLIGHYQQWFTPVHTIRISFPTEGSLGLKKGSDVEILQNVVGRIESIDVDDQDNMTGQIRIKGNWIRFVRSDSKIKVGKRYGIAGDAFVTITKGTGAQLDDDARLLVEKDTELLEIAQQLLNQVREATIPLLGQVRLTAEEYGALASDMRSPDGPLMKTMANVEGITANLRSAEGPLQKIMANLEAISMGLRNGEGTAGKLLRDPALVNEAKAIMKQVSESIAQVERILEDVKKTTAQLPPMAARVGRETDDLPGLVLQTQETLRQTQRLIEGIQQHWIIKSYIAQPQPTGLIPPSDVSVPAGGVKP